MEFGLVEPRPHVEQNEIAGTNRQTGFGTRFVVGIPCVPALSRPADRAAVGKCQTRFAWNSERIQSWTVKLIHAGAQLLANEEAERGFAHPVNAACAAASICVANCAEFRQASKLLNKLGEELTTSAPEIAHQFHRSRVHLVATVRHGSSSG